MKKLIILIIACHSFVNLYAQCDIKTNIRQDGNVIKYFNPKPIIKEKEYELGASIYKNQTSGQYLVSIIVLHKNGYSQDISGDLKIQTNSNNGISLKNIENKQVVMNGKRVTIGMFEIDKRSLIILKNNTLKSIFFEMNSKIYGSTITENKSLFMNQLQCLK
ncbi:hypothetical protein NAT47_00425 [Flavobacterium sp. HXWNR69]|uniref:DUF4251 domain-containing protein n=1 Tax=Flavobacterium fragile TaxID=2949085 RepID=A0ABT0TD38_9FLAO|nr:hypothetical protein [Flavobacterium sp. HXWNR69]MCL9768876.1 hypothetical protein [Flavobacterium sp. HXWNR69]